MTLKYHHKYNANKSTNVKCHNDYEKQNNNLSLDLECGAFSSNPCVLFLSESGLDYFLGVFLVP